jgi:hypothetical protein
MLFNNRFANTSSGHPHTAIGDHAGRVLAKFNAWSTHQTDENPTFFERHVSTLPQHSVIEGHLRDFIVESPRCGYKASFLSPAKPFCEIRAFTKTGSGQTNGKCHSKQKGVIRRVVVTGDPADILFSGTLSCREILGSTGRDAKVEVEPDWKADWQQVPSLGNIDL